MHNCIPKLFYSLVWLLFSDALLAADSPDAHVSLNYLIRTWQTDDGLPQNWVSSITQSPDGYLWIGTRYGGLARFDGLRFVSFNPANTSEIKDVQVEHVDIDPFGTVWVIMGNESITAFKNGRFHLFRQPRTEPRLRAEFYVESNSQHALFTDESGRFARLNYGKDTNSWELISPNPAASDSGRAFWTDPSGLIWYLTRDGHLAQYLNERFNVFPATGPLLRSPIKALASDDAGHFWIATANRIFQWNGSTFDEKTPTNQFPAASISQITAGQDGGLWVLDGNHLRKIFNGKWSANAALPSTLQRDDSSHSAQLYSDSAGNAWLIDYGHGLWQVEPRGDVHEFTENDGLPSAFITCWFEDGDANVWIGTAGGGLACIRQRTTHVLGPEANLPGKIARSVCVDQQGVLWAGTMSGGLAWWSTNQFVRLPLPNYNANTPLESVTVCPDSDGSLWIGSLRHGLMEFRNGKITRPSSTANLSFVRILFKDSQARLWIGGLADLYCLAHGQLRQFGSGDGFQGGVAIGNIAESGLGTIWIGTGPGDLWKYEQNRFTRYSPPRDWPSFRFAAVRPDSDGTVWIGTLGGGLLRFKNGEFFRFTSEMGLPNSFISQLLEDDQGYLWAGTYAGIDRFSKASLNAIADGRNIPLSCRVYGYSSGLRALECSSGFQPSCWASPEGRLWWATASGLAYIDPKKPFLHHESPSVIIEEMQVDGIQQPISPTNTSPYSDGGLKIEPGRHFLQFRFTGLSFESPEAIQFRVRLEGTEKQWQILHSQRTVGYGPLAPGFYCLRVQACNSEGFWTERGAFLPFIVLPFFWQTWWFAFLIIGSSFALTGLAVTLFLKRRHRIELQKLKYQHELETERARIAQDLHDDLGTSLTQISLLTALADRKIPEEESKSFNQQIRERSRDMVVALDEIVWAVNPRNDSLAELINYLGTFAEEFFRHTAIRCRLDLPDQTPDHPLSSETRHHLFLAFKESINNAARYSGASQVWLSVEILSNQIVIIMKDDGRGFAVSEKSFQPGNGLLNIKSRMEQIGGSAAIESAPGQGTVVTLNLPLN